MPDDEHETPDTIEVPLEGSHKEQFQRAHAKLQDIQSEIQEEQETLDMIFSVVIGASHAEGPVENVSLEDQTMTVGGTTFSLTDTQAERIRTHREEIQDLRSIEEKRKARLDDLVTLILDLDDIDAADDEIEILSDRIKVTRS